MMYVEPSVVLAILKEESDASVFRECVGAAGRKIISVVGKIEAAISLGRSINDLEFAPKLVDRFCSDADIATVAVDPDLFEDAVTAYRRYGKGTGHQAKLNFGDCFSYAYCKRNGATLLFKGEDFSKTDIKSAL